MKEKKHIIISIALLVLLSISIVFSINQIKTNESINKKNSQNKTEIKELNSEIDKLNNKILELEDEINAEELDPNRTCTFTETYKLIEVLDYKATVTGIKFLLLDTFQGSRPYILRVTDSQAKELKANLYYEITFTGKYSEKPDRDDYEIISITKTDKIGLNQIQESCK